ncbi:hypothetical protein PAPYR_10277 [Paratrimastix pyriformis]|uniref:DUF4283 domain-containing protein n=1 Tax=Paratrimastix pyriformis TaxID=342808 RepID=A0ABQ8UAG2_9EUKA|nr:hypothetical protein PAPYR_10277 [Paratrimastix pyriformis]
MGSGGLAGLGWLFSPAFSGGLSAPTSNCGWMVCRLGVVAALGGGCPQVGVVCLADVSLSPGWTECFASEVGPRLILRISDIWPLRCLSDRLVRWKILLWDVADAARSLGERMWPLILLRLVKGSLVIVLSFPGMGLMGAPMPASAQNLRMNGQLWTTSEGLVVTLGPVKGQRSNQDPLTPQRFLRVLEGGAAGLRKPHRVVRGKPDGDNLKKEKTPLGDNLKGHRWATPAGWGWTRWRKPRRGQPQEENPPSGTTGASLGDIGWVGTDTEEENKGTTSRRRKTRRRGQPHEGSRGEPDFGENLDGGMEDDAGDGNAAQAGDIGGILLWLRWLGLASFCLRALGTGRFGKETGSDIMVASDNVRLGDLEGLACQANWNFIVDRFKRWVGMKEGGKGVG